MKIINIDPIMKELEEALNQSIFDTDVSSCFIACALRKELQECPQIDIDTKSIEERYDQEVSVHCSNYDARYEALEDIYSDIMNSLKKIENPGE